MTAFDVLLVDDDPEVLEAYCQTLELEGLAVQAHRSMQAAMGSISNDGPIVILSDVKMPGHDGFELLEMVRSIDPDIPVLLVTGHGDIPMALKALRAGAWDFLQKPADPVHMVELIRRGLNHRKVVLENRRLRLSAMGANDWERRIVGHSPAAVAMRTTLIRLATMETDILIIGETGTGKEVAARALHDLGGRSRGQFVAVNCGAIPETMLDSELFGHEPGAFTGASHRRIGKIEHAHGGTLFLDEIESMPLGAQVRLLRVLQERSLERLGSNKEIRVDIRVVTAAKHRLIDLVDQGRFREDLAFRLDIARVELPPLRERRGDIPLLFCYFLDLAARRHGRAGLKAPPALLRHLETLSWPGNIRELRNVAERYALGISELDPRGGTMAPSAPPGRAATLEEQLERHERAILLDSLSNNGGKIGLTAEKLGISRKTLYLKMRKFGISSDETT